MSANRKKILYEVKADGSGAKSSFRGVGTSAVAMGNLVAQGAQKALGSLVRLGKEGFKFVLKSATEFTRQEQLNNRELERIFGERAGYWKKFADDMQESTNLGDEFITKFVNKLGRAIGSENVTGSLVSSMVDLNAAMGRNQDSLLPQVKQLSMAINTGTISTLQGMGIELDLTAFKAANLAERINMITEGSKRFQGAAEAQVDPLIQLKNVWGDLREELGAEFIDEIDRLVNDVILKTERRRINKKHKRYWRFV